jgi:phosphonate transport system permease protein
MNSKFKLLTPRRQTLLALAIIGILCAFYLDLNPAQLISSDGWKIASDFFAAAFHPALSYQDTNASATWDPLLLKAAKGMLRTFQYALMAMSVSLIGGLIFGFLGSKKWWPQRRKPIISALLNTAYIATRAIMAFARSIHELIWGLLFVTAIGLSAEAAVIAIAIPYSGTLGKIFSEILDEQDTLSTRTLRDIGSNSITAFLFGTVVASLPDILTYTLYRFECALRASAILGFIGIETIGYYISAAANELHWREVWTYLYVLIAVMILIDRWGAAIRHRLTTHNINTCLT